MNEFPVFSLDDNDGLVRSLMRITGFATFQYKNHRGVVGFVAVSEPSSLIGISAYGRPRLLIMPVVVQIPVLANGGDSTGFVSAVGVYALRPVDRRVRFDVPSTSVPYK